MLGQIGFLSRKGCRFLITINTELGSELVFSFVGHMQTKFYAAASVPSSERH